MGAALAYIGSGVESKHVWRKEKLPTAWTGAMYWSQFTAAAMAGGVWVGMFQHFMKHPLRFNRLRRVPWTDGARKHWSEIGGFGPWPGVTWMRSWTHGRLERAPEFRASIILWSLRMGGLAGIAFGVDTFFCLATNRPYGSNYYFRFAGGGLAGYLFAFSERVSGQARFFMATGLGVSFLFLTFFEHRMIDFEREMTESAPPPMPDSRHWSFEEQKLSHLWKAVQREETEDLVFGTAKAIRQLAGKSE